MIFVSGIRTRIWVSVAAIVLYCLVLILSILSDHATRLLIVAIIPAAVGAFYMAIVVPRSYFFLLVFLLPLSIHVNDLGVGIGLSVPGDIVIGLLAVLIMIKLLKEKKINRSLIRHPLTIVILIDLSWMTLTSLTSTITIVSLKYTFVRMAYLTVFYYFASSILENNSDVMKVVWLYSSALLLIIVYASLKHAQYGFTPEVNHWPPKPFFKDHTMYGASIAMVLPFFLLHLFEKNTSIVGKSLLLITSALLILGAFLSYSRAVWISLVIIFILYLLLLLKLKFKHLQLLILCSIAVLWFVKTPLLSKLSEIESQRADPDIREHVSSSANIESSLSNRERINRWSSAVEMLKQKPILGFGPGTYQFQYGPYQNEDNLTRLSTYFGDKGGVHSEYLKPAVESGFIGLITFLLIIYFTVKTLFQLYYGTENKKDKLLVASILLGITSYYVHGLVNFFSNTDKIAMLFWGFTAFATAQSIKMKGTRNKPSLPK